MERKELEKKIIACFLNLTPEKMFKYLHELEALISYPTYKIVISAFKNNEELINNYTPTEFFFETILRDSIKEQDKRILMAKALIKLLTNEGEQENFELLLKELKQENLKENILKVLKNALDSFKNSPPDEIYERLVVELNEIPNKLITPISTKKIISVNEALDLKLNISFEKKDKKFPTCIKAFDIVTGGFSKTELITIGAPTGQGKCLGLGTKILKYDGELIEVEKIKVGDLLMGPDNKPRKVLSISRGKGPLYEITSEYGIKWICNDEHVFTLYDTEQKKLIDIPLKQYIIKPLTERRKLKLYFSPIENFGIDYAPKDIENYANKLKINEKIDKKYLITNKQNRIKLLSILLNKFGKCKNNFYETHYIHESFIFLIRSLGFLIKKYQDKIFIFGNFSQVDIIKKPNICFNENYADFKIKSIGEGEYAGFELDGDGRFLLEDFCITHNSNIMLWLAEQYTERGYNVIFFTLEMSHEEILLRHNAIQTGIDMILLKNNQLNEKLKAEYAIKLIASQKDIEVRKAFVKECFLNNLHTKFDKEKLLKIAQKYIPRKGNLYIIDITSNCKPSNIESEIIKIKKNNSIDIVFVDFINVMESDIPIKDKPRELAAIARELKLIARRQDCLLWTAAQIDLQRAKEQGLDTESVKYSKAIVENSDWFIGFLRNKEDNMLKQIKLKLIKHRHSQPATALLQFDFSKMQCKDLGFDPDTEIPKGYTQSGEKIIEENENGVTSQPIDEYYNLLADYEEVWIEINEEKNKKEATNYYGQNDDKNIVCIPKDDIEMLKRIKEIFPNSKIRMGGI